MSREKQDYRPTMELLSSRIGNRVFIRGEELEHITGMCANTVRQKFAPARVAKGVYSVAAVARLMCP